MYKILAITFICTSSALFTADPVEQPSLTELAKDLSYVQVAVPVATGMFKGWAQIKLNKAIVARAPDLGAVAQLIVVDFGYKRMDPKQHNTAALYFLAPLDKKSSLLLHGLVNKADYKNASIIDGYRKAGLSTAENDGEHKWQVMRRIESQAFLYTSLGLIAYDLSKYVYTWAMTS